MEAGRAAFLARRGTDQLITIDTTTGAGAAVGALGFANVEGLAFDANANKLYGTDVATAQLIRINKITGAGTAVGPTGFSVFGLSERIPWAACPANRTPLRC